MGIIQLLMLLPVLVQSVEMFLPGAGGPTKLGLVFRLIDAVLKYPVKVYTDIRKGDYKSLSTDIVAILVDVANQTGTFQHGTPASGADAGGGPVAQ